jgi:hypothetical protein
MSETKFFVKQGLVQKSKGDILGGFNLNRFFKWAAGKYNIPYVDECCSDDQTTFPMQFNSTSAQVEYINASGDAVSVDSAESVTAVSAFATGGQASATALAPGFNEVTTVITAGDSVKLPAAVEGLVVSVKNDGATAADVFPASGDTINDAAADAAIRIAPGNVIIFRAINATNWETDRERVATADGTVGAPAFSFNNQVDMGLYKVSATQLGVSVSGALKGGFGSAGLFTDNITEQTSGAGITLAKNPIQKRTATAVNITGSITTAATIGGLITSTSAAAVTATLDTAANIATAAGAVQGTTIDFIVDNIGGANTVTVAVNTGITAITAVITGGATLTVASGTAGMFRLYFTSTSAAKLARVF